MEEKEMIQKLKEAADRHMEAAKILRTEDPEGSMFSWKFSEVLKAAAEDLESRLPVPAEIEGGDRCWFYVCGNCHTAINPRDVYCRVCGRKVELE